jgi:protein-S-isoprenylcysteine O-methyltransferase Ste14
MSKKSLLLVILQFLCFAFFALNGGLFTKGILLLFQIIGLAIGLWGIVAMKLGNLNIQPEVKQNAEFISNGPYKLIRNPMYTGLLIFFGISVFINFSYVRLGVLMILTIVLLMKIFMEEQFLSERFEKEYLDYKKKTYRLIPFVF